MKNLKFLYLLTLVLFVLASCNDDEPVEPENEEEVITDMVVTLTSFGGDVQTLTFTDPDGDGGNAPTITGATLKANETYVGILTLTGADEDITAEVLEEDDEHQFFFETTDLNLTVQYNDQDADGNPLGQAVTVNTGDASMGSLKVTLVHEPVKDASGVSDGDITNAQGEIDIEVSFPVEVQ